MLTSGKVGEHFVSIGNGSFAQILWGVHTLVINCPDSSDGYASISVAKAFS